MVIISLVGWALLLAGCVCGFQAWDADRRMQRFRVPGASPASYLFVPVRWQRRLYTREGEELVDLVWKRTFAMYGYAGAGVLLLAIGGGN